VETGNTGDVIDGNTRPGPAVTATGNISVVEMAVAGLLLSAGTMALIFSVVIGGSAGKDGDQAWTVVGSSLMGLGSLLMVIGICWSMAKSSSVTGSDQQPGEILQEVRVDA